MRTKRNRSAEHPTKRRKQPKSKGVPKLSLWECGIGAVWK